MLVVDDVRVEVPVELEVDVEEDERVEESDDVEVAVRVDVAVEEPVDVELLVDVDVEVVEKVDVDVDDDVEEPAHDSSSTRWVSSREAVGTAPPVPPVLVGVVEGLAWMPMTDSPYLTDEPVACQFLYWADPSWPQFRVFSAKFTPAAVVAANCESLANLCERISRAVNRFPPVGSVRMLTGVVTLFIARAALLKPAHTTPLNG